jgi:hypothetical protein
MRTFSLSLAVALATTLGGAAQRPAAPERSNGLSVVQLRPNFYVIGGGAGGNVVVEIGPEGVILVDSGSTEGATTTWSRTSAGPACWRMKTC